MLIIPSIDLRKGLCVRLTQGRKEDVRTYDCDPVEIAGKALYEGRFTLREALQEVSAID